jgi:tetratricopeptide (TPR) repeat protein
MSDFAPASLLVLLLAAGCAQQPVQSDMKVAGAPRAAADVPQAAKPAAAQAKRHRPPLPKLDLSEELMFKLMLAEVAAQRHQPQIAVSAYLDLARETHDPRIAKRATEIAWNARMVSEAMEAAGLWLQADPDSAQARQILAALLVNQSELDQARPHLEKWLAADPQHVGASFLQLSKLLSRNKDRQGVLNLLQALAKPYADVPEARLVVAQAAWNAGAQQIALDESAAALKLKPDWELAALFHAQALQRRSSKEAIDFLGGYLEAHPHARDARLNYARLLATDHRYSEARKQFETLLAANPGNGDLTMAVAALAMQASDYDTASELLHRVLDSNYKEPDAARLLLGQIAEERERYDEALGWYGKVGTGTEYIAAQSRYAAVLAKQGKLDEARAHLHRVKAANNAQRVQLWQAEAQLLREANRYQDAYDVLGHALEQLPNYPDLLYDHAMAAEKVARYDVLESDLRKLIEIRPESAHAYNALGYTLADRNERLPEARKLIETALNLSPDDPFIMDSMGWVLYRMGQTKDALDQLQRAYLLRHDAEIAAHLGEVLWNDGQQERAQQVWSDALKTDGKNELLQSTIRRFAPRILPAAAR